MNKKITCFTDSVSVKTHQDTFLIELILYCTRIEAECGNAIVNNTCVIQEVNVDLSAQGGCDKIHYCLIEYLKEKSEEEDAKIV